MPRKCEIELFQFDDLDDSAKERAREWYRKSANDAGDTYFVESVIENAEQIAEHLGITLMMRTVKLMNGKTRQEPKIWWEVSWSQGSGASYEANFYASDIDIDALRAEWPECETNAKLWAMATQFAQLKGEHSEDGLMASITPRGRHHALEIDVRVDDEYELDSKDEDACEQALRDFAGWIHAQLEAEYEYQYSDETVDDNIRANEYEFTEDGERH